MEFDVLFPTFPTVDNIIRMAGTFPIEGGITRCVLENYKEPGAGGNIMIVFRRMGGTALMIGPVGNDMDGDYLLREYERLGFTTEELYRVDGYKTPVANCLVDEAGIHSFVSEIGYCEYSTREEILRQVSRCKSYCLSGYNLVTGGQEGRNLTLSILREAHILNKDVFFDPGPLIKDMDPIALEEVIQKSTIIVLNDEELTAITGVENVEEASEALAGRTEACILAKAGGRGCFVCSSSRKGRWYPGFSVKLVDTMGCGDSFLGAFMHGWLQGWDLDTCVVFANAAGAVKASKFGTGTKVPTFTEMVEILEANGYNIPNQCKEENRFTDLVFKA